MAVVSGSKSSMLVRYSEGSMNEVGMARSEAEITRRDKFSSRLMVVSTVASEKGVWK